MADSITLSRTDLARLLSGSSLSQLPSEATMSLVEQSSLSARTVIERVNLQASMAAVLPPEHAAVANSIIASNLDMTLDELWCPTGKPPIPIKLPVKRLFDDPMAVLVASAEFQRAANAATTPQVKEMFANASKALLNQAPQPAAIMAMGAPIGNPKQKHCELVKRGISDTIASISAIETMISTLERELATLKSAEPLNTDRITVAEAKLATLKSQLASENGSLAAFQQEYVEFCLN